MKYKFYYKSLEADIADTDAELKEFDTWELARDYALLRFDKESGGVFVIGTSAEFPNNKNDDPSYFISSNVDDLINYLKGITGESIIIFEYDSYESCAEIMCCLAEDISYKAWKKK